MLSTKVFSKVRRVDHGTLILAVFSVVFFFIYAYFTLSSPHRFVSPDETANYFFAQRFAHETSLTLSEPLNNLAGGIVHPRNIGAYGTLLLPEGSIGLMVIGGALAKVFGLWVISLLVPILAAITPVFLFLILRRVFSERVAFISALGLFMVPGFWYYASRSLMNNLPFVALLVLALYFGIKLAERPRWITSVLFGVSLGLSLLTRTSEVFWVAAAALASWIAAGRRWRAPQLITAGLVVVACLTPFFIFNNSHFHSPLASALRRNFVDTPAVASDGNWLAALGKLLFPFGIHLDTVAVNFVRYGLIIFSWWSAFWLIGWAGEWIKALRNRAEHVDQVRSRGRMMYLVIYSLAAVWLLLMYGSWSLQEYEDPNRIILGHSLVRYWLPITVFGMPYFVMGVQRVVRLFKRRAAQLVMISGIGLAFVVLSANIVLDDPLYGLTKIKSDVQSYQAINKQTVSLTEPDAVIIAGVADKVFYPERKVIIEYSPTSSAYLDQLRHVSERAPLYCYTIGLADACAGLDHAGEYNSNFSAALTEVARFDNGAILYRVKVN